MKQRGTQRENVRKGAKARLRGVLFRGCVVLSQYASVSRCPLQHELPCCSKVDQYCPVVIGQDDVGRFDVAVQHVVPVHCSQRVTKATRYRENFIFRQLTQMLYSFLQGLPSQEFHNNICRTILLKYCIYLHYVG